MQSLIRVLWESKMNLKMSDLVNICINQKLTIVNSHKLKIKMSELVPLNHDTLKSTYHKYTSVKSHNYIGDGNSRCSIRGRYPTQTKDDALVLVGIKLELVHSYNPWVWFPFHFSFYIMQKDVDFFGFVQIYMYTYVCVSMFDISLYFIWFKEEFLSWWCHSFCLEKDFASSSYSLYNMIQVFS